MIFSDFIKTIGREWAAGDKHRIYISDSSLIDLAGLTLQFYGTGNIGSATMHGERISNYRAKRILGSLPHKMWYDCHDDQMHWISDDAKRASDIANRIRTKFAALHPETDPPPAKSL